MSVNFWEALVTDGESQCFDRRGVPESDLRTLTEEALGRAENLAFRSPPEHIHSRIRILTTVDCCGKDRADYNLKRCVLKTPRSSLMEPYYYTEIAEETPSIATLGDTKTSITCSQHVAKARYPNSVRFGSDSFEDAANLIKQGEAMYLLVPGAYPHISRFLMDDDLLLHDTFKMKIPELVYGNVVNDALVALETIYHHAAVTSLLPKVPGYNCGAQFVPVSSNEKAYEAMICHGERAGCVSNQLVFDHYGRPSLITLRTARDMAWLVFSARARAVFAKAS